MQNKKPLYIFLLIGIILIALILMLIYLDNKPVQLSIKEPVFLEANEYIKSNGYNTICITENASYILKDEVLENKENIIKRFETMFELAKKEYGMKFNPPYIFISDNPNEVNRDFSSFTVSVDDPFSLGVPFYYASGGKLPAWICSGLENYWAEIYNFPIAAKKIRADEITTAFKDDTVQKLPSFSDAWLIANFNEGTDINVLCDYAYNFIYYLAKTNQLSNYIKLANSNYSTFIIKSREMMDLFSKGMWRGNMSIYMHYNYGEDFSINTAEAIYKYEPYTWNLDDIVSWTEEMDAGIIFIKNFINFDYEDQLDITLTADYKKYSRAYGSKIILNKVNIGPEACTHEAAHALCYLSGNAKKTSAFFEEGFASFLCSLFDNEYKTIRYKRYHKILIDIPDDYTKEIAKIYDEQILKLDKDMEFDIGISIDAQAILEFKVGERRNPLLQSASTDNYLGNILTNEMYSYYKAESFVSYLYKSYGKEKLINAYCDNTKIEELYGKPLLDLVNEWKIYLAVIKEAI